MVMRKRAVVSDRAAALRRLTKAVGSTAFALLPESVGEDELGVLGLGVLGLDEPPARGSAAWVESPLPQAASATSIRGTTAVTAALRRVRLRMGSSRWAPRGLAPLHRATPQAPGVRGRPGQGNRAPEGSTPERFRSSTAPSARAGPPRSGRPGRAAPGRRA